MMHIGKSTLSAACTETYGLSVMALMRQVRLEQCRMAMLKPDRGTTVDTVMRKYRFNNRARFAATYRDAFVNCRSHCNAVWSLRSESSVHRFTAAL